MSGRAARDGDLTPTSPAAAAVAAAEEEEASAVPPAATLTVTPTSPAAAAVAAAEEEDASAVETSGISLMAGLGQLARRGAAVLSWAARRRAGALGRIMDIKVGGRKISSGPGKNAGGKNPPWEWVC